MGDRGLQACTKNLIRGVPCGYGPVRNVPHVPRALCELQVDVEAVRVAGTDEVCLKEKKEAPDLLAGNWRPFKELDPAIPAWKLQYAMLDKRYKPPVL